MTRVTVERQWRLNASHTNKPQKSAIVTRLYCLRTARTLFSRSGCLLVFWSGKYDAFILNQSITVFQLSLPILPWIILICIFTDRGQKDRSMCNNYINNYLSFCWLVINWSADRDAKFKIVNEIKRDIERELVTWYVNSDAKFKMAERCHAFFGLRLARYISYKRVCYYLQRNS